MRILVGVSCLEHENGDDDLGPLESKQAFCHPWEAPVDEEGNMTDVTIERCVRHGYWKVDFGCHSVGW